MKIWVSSVKIGKWEWRSLKVKTRISGKMGKWEWSGLKVKIRKKKIEGENENEEDYLWCMRSW